MRCKIDLSRLPKNDCEDSFNGISTIEVTTDGDVYLDEKYIGELISKNGNELKIKQMSENKYLNGQIRIINVLS